jgi:hypothetical protein
MGCCFKCSGKKKLKKEKYIRRRARRQMGRKQRKDGGK